MDDGPAGAGTQNMVQGLDAASLGVRAVERMLEWKPERGLCILKPSQYNKLVLHSAQGHRRAAGDESRHVRVLRKADITGYIGPK